jgi:hypothetical protein
MNCSTTQFRYHTPNDMGYQGYLCSICCTDIAGMYTIGHSGNDIVTVIHTNFAPVSHVLWGNLIYTAQHSVKHVQTHLMTHYTHKQ